MITLPAEYRYVVHGYSCVVMMPTADERQIRRRTVVIATETGYANERRTCQQYASLRMVLCYVH